MVKMRSAVIVGATGLVGAHLVQQLCENDYYISVTALSRRELSYNHPKLIVKKIDFDHLQEQDFDFAEVIFCCLGTTRKKAGSREKFEKVDVEYPLRVAQIAKKKGANHFIVISAMGANEKSLAYYNRVKGKLEKQLVELDFPQLSIVRPSLLVGKRDEFRLGEKLGEAVLAVLNPILVGPLKKYRSILGSQVAEAMTVISLHEKPDKVEIYESNQLAQLKLLDLLDDQEAISSKFNWRLAPPVDEEVVFDRSKIKTVDDKPLREQDRRDK